jgi:hypothetical protein
MNNLIKDFSNAIPYSDSNFFPFFLFILYIVLMKLLENKLIHLEMIVVVVVEI